MKKLYTVLAATFTFASFFVSASHADTFYFNDSNVFGAAASTPPGYGSVVLAQDATGVEFTISANTSFFTPDPGGPGLTWDKFFFNNTGSILSSDVTLGAGLAGTWSLSLTQQASQYGVFDFKYSGTAIGSNSIDPLVLHINGITLASVELFNADGWEFAGHLRDFAVNGQRSSFLGVGTSPNPVPEPVTMLLFGTGLAELAGIARRKLHQG